MDDILDLNLEESKNETAESMQLQAQSMFVITFLFGPLSIILNFVTVLAVLKIKVIRTNIRLVCSLVASDIIITLAFMIERGIDCQYEVNFKKPFHCVKLMTSVMKLTSHVGSLFSLTGLALDLYVAIIHPLNYASLMNEERVSAALVGIWLSAAVIGSLQVYMPVSNQSTTCFNIHTKNFCKNASDCNIIQTAYCVMFVLIFCSVVISFAYGTIFRQIRSLHRDPARLSDNQSIKRNRRGLATTIIILFVFISCFLPYYGVLLAEHLTLAKSLFVKHSFFDAAYYLQHLFLLHAVIDPILYAYRLRDVKLGYMRLFGIRTTRSNTYISAFNGRSISSYHAGNHSINQHENSVIYSPVGSSRDRIYTRRLTDSSTHDSQRRRRFRRPGSLLSSFFRSMTWRNRRRNNNYTRNSAAKSWYGEVPRDECFMLAPITPVSDLRLE